MKNEFCLFGLWGFGPYLAVLGGCYVVSGIEPGLAACKAGTVSPVLSSPDSKI